MKITLKSQPPGNPELKPSLLPVPAFIVCVQVWDWALWKDLLRDKQAGSFFSKPSHSLAKCHTSGSFSCSLVLPSFTGLLKEDLLIPSCTIDKQLFSLIWLTVADRSLLSVLYFAAILGSVFQTRSYNMKFRKAEYHNAIFTVTANIFNKELPQETSRLSLG